MVTEEEILKEIIFTTSRSSGRGGQHVNKTETRVEASFSIPDSALLSGTEKERLGSRLGNRLTKEGILRVVSQEERSQLLNKQTALKKLVRIVNRALKTEKPRKPTRPTRVSVEKRLEEKAKRAARKQSRKPPPLE